MQEKEWMRAFGRCNSWSTRARKSRRGNDHAGRKSRARGAEPPQAGRPAWPINGAPSACLLQASNPLLPLFVCSSFCAQNHRNIAILPELDCSNNSHP
jgi:hypothetical protein